MASFLVTGGLGFIGSAFVRRAALDGHEVLNIDSITYAADFENVADISDLENYDFVKGDVGDSVLVKQCLQKFQPDYIVHFAAETHVDRSIKSPIKFSQTNVIGTACLLDACCEHWFARGCPENFRFFHVSTDEVFGSIEKPYRSLETDAYWPNSPYSASKASSNHLVRAYHQTFGLPVLIGNASNTYGPFQHSEKLIPMILKNAWNLSPIMIYGDGENVRDWLFVEDHIEAIFRVIEIGQIGSTYNIGSDHEYTNNQIVALVCDILAIERPNSSNYLDLVTYTHDRPGHDMRYSLNITKIKREIGWSPSTDISDGLAKTIRFFIGRKN